MLPYQCYWCNEGIILLLIKNPKILRPKFSIRSLKFIATLNRYTSSKCLCSDLFGKDDLFECVGDPRCSEWTTL